MWRFPGLYNQSCQVRPKFAERVGILNDGEGLVTESLLVDQSSESATLYARQILL